MWNIEDILKSDDRLQEVNVSTQKYNNKRTKNKVLND
tara:strand:- start:504 stop:614 length:111 start_codon:yes stop_codon:yes gene_type:complete